MKNILVLCMVIVLALLLIIIAVRMINAGKTKIKTPLGIQESTYIDINGIKQYVQIRGENTDNPVMIFIHGGPASPMGYVSSYYSERTRIAAYHYQL